MSHVFKFQKRGIMKKPTERDKATEKREKNFANNILNITTNNLVAILNAIKKALTTALVRE